MKILAADGFKSELIEINISAKSFKEAAHFLLTLKDGIIGKRIKVFKSDIKEMEIVNQEQSADSLQKALSDKRSVFKVRVTTNQGEKMLLEMKTNACEDIFKFIMEVDLKTLINEDRYKKSA